MPRSEIDAILLPKLTWGESGSTALVKATIRFKVLANRAKETIRLRNENADAGAGKKGKKGVGKGVLRNAGVEKVNYFKSSKHVLAERLTFLGCEEHMISGDGNCQFRALSSELFGTQQHHAYVRLCIVEHMRAPPDDFSPFVAESFEKYLKRMARLRCWGDELTLRAALDYFGACIHLITSDSKNWHILYTPTEAKSDRHLFLSYISPVHYNTVRPSESESESESPGGGEERASE